MSAVSASREALIQLLLEHGADVHATNSSGQTSLHYAVRSGRLFPARILCPILPQALATISKSELERRSRFKGAPATAMDQTAPPSAVWVISATMQASKARTDGICRLLLAKGALTTAKDSTGSAPLHRYRQSSAEHSRNLPLPETLWRCAASQKL